MQVNCVSESKSALGVHLIVLKVTQRWLCWKKNLVGTFRPKFFMSSSSYVRISPFVLLLLQAFISRCVCVLKVRTLFYKRLYQKKEEWWCDRGKEREGPKREKFTHIRSFIPNHQVYCIYPGVVTFKIHFMALSVLYHTVFKLKYKVTTKKNRDPPLWKFMFEAE